MPEQKLTANLSAIRADLAYMTRRWGELSEPAQFELRAFGEGKQPQTARFKPEWIDDAVDWAAKMNTLGFNIYCVRNPVRADCTTSAKDGDILASFFLWADCDDPDSAGNVYRFDGPKWSAAVTTGRAPSPRVHVYWELTEPCRDMAAWRQMQIDIAAHFQSDGAVINPSRIMRVGGTVTYPDSRKRGKGYVSEIATIRTEYDDRPPVTFDQMRRVFPSVGAVSHANTAPGIFALDAGTATKTIAEYADMLTRARTDGAKHTGVRDLAAHLAGSGVKRDMAEAIIRGACPVWDVGVEKLIETAYAKFWKPEAAPDLTAEERQSIPAAMFRPWARINLAAIPSPEFVYSDFFARGYTSLTLAAPKVGKSMLGLAEALDMATGRGFLTGVPRDPLRVVYYNAEDDQDVLDARVAALLTEYDIDQSEIEGRFWPTSGVEANDFYMVQGEKGVINETLFVALEKFCSEQRADVLIFDPLQDLSTSPETNEVFRMLGQRLRRMASICRVSVGIIHHTRKVAPGMPATIDDGRGGSALRGTSRFNRILNPMTEDEAMKAGVANHRFYFRIGDMESNLAPPSADVNRWYEKRSIMIPNGEYVGAVVPWQWPDAFDGVTPQDAARVRMAINAMQSDPPRLDAQARNWAGYEVARVLRLDADDKAQKARIKQMIKTWVETGVLAVEERHDSRNGRTTKLIIAGENSPNSEA